MSLPTKIRDPDSWDRAALRIRLAVSTSVAWLLAFAAFSQAQESPAAQSTARPAAALQAYEEGRALWGTRRAADLQASLIPLQRAVELAPDWADAHSALADSLSLLGLYAARPAAETLPLAAAAAGRALELDPELGSAHASLGLTLYLFEHSYAAAEKSFQRALELDPTNHAAHHWLGMMLSALKRHGEALDHIDQAISISPKSSLLCNKRATILRNAGLRGRARAQLEECASQHGPSTLNLREIASLDILEEDWDAARNNLLAAQERAPADLRVLALLGFVAGMTADAALSREVQEVLGELSEDRYVPISTLLGIYVAEEDRDRALRTLEQAIDAGEAGIVYIDTRPELAVLRHEPRFQRALSRLGLPGK